MNNLIFQNLDLVVARQFCRTTNKWITPSLSKMKFITPAINKIHQQTNNDILFGQKYGDYGQNIQNTFLIRAFRPEDVGELTLLTVQDTADCDKLKFVSTSRLAHGPEFNWDIQWFTNASSRDYKECKPSWEPSGEHQFRRICYELARHKITKQSSEFVLTQSDLSAVARSFMDVEKYKKNQVVCLEKKIKEDGEEQQSLDLKNNELNCKIRRKTTTFPSQALRIIISRSVQMFFASTISDFAKFGTLQFDFGEISLESNSIDETKKLAIAYSKYPGDWR